MDCASAGEDARTTAGETPALQVHPVDLVEMAKLGAVWVRATPPKQSLDGAPSGLRLVRVAKASADPSLLPGCHCTGKCGRGRPRDSRRDAGATSAPGGPGRDGKAGSGLGSCYPTQAKLGWGTLWFAVGQGREKQARILRSFQDETALESAGEDARTTAGETPALQVHPLFSGQILPLRAVQCQDDSRIFLLRTLDSGH